jgi:multicomponent Na+:H+ antiporter subunit D
LLALYAFGIGKAALMPVHRWLPSAMVAPAPVSALLHAVAVVKAGAFTMLKVVTQVFGTDLLATIPAAQWLSVAAAVSMVVASLVALRQDDLKARLAYSTVSQLAYITLGAALFTGPGSLGAALQIVMHGVAKITLFFCAGAIYVATGAKKVSELDGLGRAMPLVFLAFLAGALSVIGLPPFGGSWSKWELMLAAAHSAPWALGALVLSAVLNAAYLLPLVARAFFRQRPDDGPAHVPAMMLVPLCLTALGTLALFLGADPLARLVLPALVGGPG